MPASSDATIGRHRISTKTVPAVGFMLGDLLSAHTSGCAEGADSLGSELRHTVAEWTPCVAPDDSGEGSMAVVDSVLRICIVKTGLDTLQFRDFNGTAHCSTRRWWPRVCRGRVGVSPPQLQCGFQPAMFTRESREELLHGHWIQLLIRRAGGGHSWYPPWK